MKQRRLDVLEQIVKCTQRGRISVLEIGSYEGASALHWDRCISRFKKGGSVMCVDPWRPYPSAPESMRSDLARGEVFRRFIKNTSGRCIHYFVGSLADYVRATFPSSRNAFDVVFIDGDHTNEAVLNDLRLGAACLRDGGILCGDDLDEDYPGVISAVRKFFDREIWNKNEVFAMRKDAEGYGWVSID